MRRAGESQFESKVREEGEGEALPVHRKASFYPYDPESLAITPSVLQRTKKKEKTDSPCRESSLSTGAYPHTTPIRPSSPFLPHNHHPTHPPTPTQPSPTSCKEKVIIKKKKSLENANKFYIYSFIHPSIRSLSHSPPFSQRFVAPRFSSIDSATSETKVIQWMS